MSEEQTTEISQEPAENAEKTYKVVCISMYNEDAALVDELVKKLKELGVAKINRSSLIRYAVHHIGTADEISKTFGS